MSDITISNRRGRRHRGAAWLVAAALSPACAVAVEAPIADLVLRNGGVYTLAWQEPERDGTPADDAPYDGAGWHPDATSVAVGRGSILYVGDDAGVEVYIGAHTRVVDLGGATVVPGLADAHTHVLELGANLEHVDLVGVDDEAEAVARVVARAADVAPGEWIIGHGWDEGEWADRYPSKRSLEPLTENPVLLRGLHGFAVWANQAALDAAGITAATEEPSGGRILRDAGGDPTGILLDRATTLLTDAVPSPDIERLEARMVLGLEAMAAAGYTMVHEAGVGARQLRAIENLAAAGRLPLRVYAMLSARDPDLLRQWKEWGPDVDGNDRLITRSVKAYYDGALGSRGARLLDEYSDLPGHFGVSGDAYGFDRELVAEMIDAGFQASVHAIGDAGNRETLAFFASAGGTDPDAEATARHRVEHAQVLHPGDFWRFRRLGLIASVQPPHAVEDMSWAEQRLGPERVTGAYAWRTFRLLEIPVVLSSDLPGSDHDFFYGLHAAVTRRDKQLAPPDGWYPRQRLTIEEGLRGYTTWAAYAAFVEDRTGRVEPGLWADLTVIDIDPFALAESDPGGLLRGRVLMTIVGGRVTFEAP